MFGEYKGGKGEERGGKEEENSEKCLTCRDSLFKDVNGGIHDAAVDIPKLLEAE